MQTRVVVIYNRTAGSTGDVSKAEILQALRGRGLEADLVEPQGESISDAARHAARAGAGRVITAGGDGTLSAVVQGIAGTAATLGVLPLGTLNHFAKDLHLPLDWRAALEVAVAGEVERVDLAEVNGRYFLNNSSIGLYPQIVLQRERMQRSGVGKWLALCRAVLAVVRRAPALEVRLKMEGMDVVERTLSVFVGNNKYELEGVRLGSRRSIENGELHVIATRAAGKAELARAAWQAFRGEGNSANNPPLRTMFTDELTITTRRGWLMVAVDGEVVPMRTPLRYRIHPRALAVAVPRREEKVA